MGTTDLSDAKTLCNHILHILPVADIVTTILLTSSPYRFKPWLTKINE
jgi:hypothetical protein